MLLQVSCIYSWHLKKEIIYFISTFIDEYVYCNRCWLHNISILLLFSIINYISQIVQPGIFGRLRGLVTTNLVLN